MLALKEWDTQQGILNASPCCNSIRPETPDPLGIKQKLNQNPHTTMPEEIFYGEEMESIRQAMREGRRHSACETCWRIEDRQDADDQSSRSYRMQSVPSGFLIDYDKSQSLIDNPKLSSIDFAFGENCNLRCRMCSPGLSNKLRIDYKYFVDNDIDTDGIEGFDYEKEWPNTSKEKRYKYNPHLHPNASTQVHNWSDAAQWQNILDNMHTINHIKATGGETLLSKPFIEFLDSAIERGFANKIMLEFHTNATKFTDDIISKLLQFEGLHFNLSIDSVDKNYEYIRYPMLWNKLDASLRNLLNNLEGKHSPRDSVKHFEHRDKIVKNFSFNIVLSILNAHYLPDLFKYQQELLKEYNSYQYAVFYIDLLWPENKYINVKFLPTAIKQELIDLYTDMSSTELDCHSEVALDFLKQHIDYQPTEQDRLNMLKEITVFDKSRNQSYNNYLHPSIVEFLETPL